MSSHQNVKPIALRLEQKGCLSVEADETDGGVISCQANSFSNLRLDFSFFAPYYQPMTDIAFPISVLSTEIIGIVLGTKTFNTQQS